MEIFVDLVKIENFANFFLLMRGVFSKEKLVEYDKCKTYFVSSNLNLDQKNNVERGFKIFDSKSTNNCEMCFFRSMI
jgi:hypothetical protein